MANLKIKVGAFVETSLTIQAFNYYITYSQIPNYLGLDLPTYDDAKQYFSTSRSTANSYEPREVLIVFNKTSDELNTLSSYGGRYIFNIKGTYNNTIKKIRFKVTKNVYSFPNGMINTDHNDINENDFIVGVGGELFLDGVAQPTSLSQINHDYLLPANLNYDFMLPIEFKNYQSIQFENYFKSCKSRGEITIQLLDENDNVIPVTEGSTKSEIKVGRVSLVSERRKTISVGESVVIKNSYSDNIPTSNEIILKKTPTNGTLKLNGVDVALNASISVAQIDAGNLVYTATSLTNGADDVIPFAFSNSVRSNIYFNIV